MRYISFPSGAVVKNLPASAGDARDTSSVPCSGRSPGRGDDNPLGYSRLPGKLQGQKSLAGYIQSMGSQRVRRK